MTENSIKKASIIIDLPLHLQDFIRHELKSEQGYIIAKKTHEIGLFIDSMWELSRTPIEVNAKNPCEIFLSNNPDNQYNLTAYYCYVPTWRQVKIKNYIEACLRLRVFQYFSIAYSKGFSQKAIIESFLYHYNIKFNEYNYDTIKKMDFRNRRKVSDLIAKEINDYLSKFG